MGARVRRATARPLVAGGTELQELEGLHSEAASQWAHELPAEDLVQRLFSSLLDDAEHERQRVERLKQCHVEPIARQNRRGLYLDSDQRHLCEERSRQFLARRHDVASTLSIEALYSGLALQHILELEVVNLSLPAESQFSDSSCLDGINEQFLLDAPRTRYCIKGVMHFWATSRSHEDKDAFLARLVNAMRQAVPAKLLPLTTTVMSQSGLAALERASLCSVAVSGGRHEVDFGIEADPDKPNCVIVTMQTRKRGFSEFYASTGDDPFECDEVSCIRKSATVELHIDGTVDVVSYSEDINLLRNGELLPCNTWKVVSAPPLDSPRNSSTSRARGSCQESIVAACRCAHRSLCLCFAGCMWPRDARHVIIPPTG
mmetsp:Transcript_67923/g.126899  ORF Transcript_67923/g.126899 Transcript_67923/m.126899 type:complete len:374 (-) Transcript_67923:22-1143(-)